MMATETIKLILGIGTPLIGYFMVYDALGASFHKVSFSKQPDCQACGDSPHSYTDRFRRDMRQI
jgi:adenylyltransferase/sulfurtransferase